MTGGGSAARGFLDGREDELLALAFSGPHVAVILAALGYVPGARWVLVGTVLPAAGLAVAAAVRGRDPWERAGLAGLALAGLLDLVLAAGILWCVVARRVPPAPVAWAPVGVLVLAAVALRFVGGWVEADALNLARGSFWLGAGGVTLGVAELAFALLGPC